MKHRSIVILTVSFVVVLAAGVALAQVGAFAPSFSELAQKSDTVASDIAFLPKVEKPEPPPAVKAPVDDQDVRKEEPPAKQEPKDSVLDKPEQPVDEPKKEEPVEEPTDTTPPKLAVTSPTEGAHFGEKTLKYAGVTEPGARVFAGEWEADVFDSGEWHIVLVLSPGKNVTTFTAKDKAGNKASATVTAYLDGSDVGETEFTAHQKYGTSSEPWEKFYGTAAPGTKIVLMATPWKATMVTEGPEWLLKLHFEGLKEPTTVPIVLETSTGRRMEFTFTYQPKAIEFTANQKYGSCSEPEPYDVFVGTARPGVTITATTEGHGSASTKAGDFGNWDLKVFFTETAPDQPFDVTVSDSDGHVKTFKFVSYAGGEK
ncbi:MAG: hypothetical protein OEM81_11320 [Acidimicrobiia bacterium]|nr:hypothetical protein [Acidimicrobiia bacterium]